MSRTRMANSWANTFNTPHTTRHALPCLSGCVDVAAPKCCPVPAGWGECHGGRSKTFTTGWIEQICNSAPTWWLWRLRENELHMCLLIFVIMNMDEHGVYLATSLCNRHDWCILWAYRILIFFLIGLSFPWVFFSFVSPLKTKQNKWKLRKPKENHRIHPAPNQRKSKEIKGNRRKPKEIKGTP